MPIGPYSRNIKTTLRGRLLKQFDQECVELEMGHAGTLRHMVSYYLAMQHKRRQRQRRQLVLKALHQRR